MCLRGRRHAAYRCFQRKQTLGSTCHAIPEPSKSTWSPQVCSEVTKTSTLNLELIYNIALVSLPFVIMLPGTPRQLIHLRKRGKKGKTHMSARQIKWIWPQSRRFLGAEMTPSSTTSLTNIWRPCVLITKNAPLTGKKESSWNNLLMPKSKAFQYMAITCHGELVAHFFGCSYTLIQTVLGTDQADFKDATRINEVRD